MDTLLNSAKQSLSSALLTDACETETERIVRPFNSEPINFPLNSIKTSRFTALNFLPKAFFEQFRRLANVYFLVIGAIAIVGTYSNYYKSAVEPAGVLLPMTVVILISVVKEGLEDFKRHRTDAEIDARRARRVAYDGRVESVRWDQLTVGTVVLLLCDDAIPADVVVVSCGGIQGPTAYVETAAIDGESNLKIKLPCYHSRASKGEALRGHKRKEESSAAAALYGSTYCPPLVCSRVQKALEGGDCNRVDCSAPQPIQTLGSIGQAVAGVEDGDIRDSMIRLQSNNIRSDDEISRRPSTHDPLHILVSTDKTYVYGCNNIASAIMKTDAASEYINAFNGSILFHTEMSASESVALSGINFLLRGSMLKATEWYFVYFT